MDELNEKILDAYNESILGINEAAKLSVPQKHQLAIAKKTLKMSDAGASVMGGMSKKEAVEFLKSIGYSDAKIKKMSESDNLDEAYKVAQNPSDKLWYALGSVGKYWMPVSSGYKSKKEAEAYAKKQPMANAAAKKLMPEGLDEQVRPKNVKLTFRVWPEGMKPRTYKDLNGMAKDFNEEQLKDASISLIIGSSIIETLPRYAVEKILDEIF